MAITLVGTTKRYIGTSSDARPTDDIAIGSTLYVVDTGELLIYDGSDWHEKDRAESAADATNDLLREMLEVQKDVLGALKMIQLHSGILEEEEVDDE